ncbi:MAG: tRNA lysidine(34) synthetase TilS [Pseudomonadota bacterium]
MTGTASDDTLEARFAARMGALLGPDFPNDIALAVSGGGDSMAMLALAHGWARVYGVRLWVVTVDHGLRPESAAEAEMVARECAALGHPHATLRWQWDGTGNVQDQARRARLRLIDQWRRAIDHVLFAHTQDDVAETFLMRLARGSGVEGLAAMSDQRRVKLGLDGRTHLDVTETAPPPRSTRRVAGVPAYSPSFTLVRPLLHEARADLRHYADTLRVPYVDDPSNTDPRFDRARIRAALATLADQGISTDTLARTAHRMRRARPALAARAAQVAEAVVEQETVNDCATGDLLIDLDGFQTIERDTQLRVIAGALMWISGATYRPRADPLEALLDRGLSGGGGTLHGCDLRAQGVYIRISREYAALRDLHVDLGESTVFDRRWRASGRRAPGHTLRALGEDGWAQIPEKTPQSPPFHAALSLPAIFAGETVIACPALGLGDSGAIMFYPPTHRFAAFLESD